jgi:hypothetical protein
MSEYGYEIEPRPEIQSYTYTIEPRPEELGGGWRLCLLEEGEEVGGGVFPEDEYQDAVETAEDWLSSRNNVRT